MNATLKTQPILWILIISKLFERFVYYGWRSFIFLFLVDNVIDKNELSREDVLATYSSIIGLIAIASLTSAIIADKQKCNAKIAYIGFIVTALGFASTWMFANELYYIPIIFITIGIGIISPNLTALFGKLYWHQNEKLFQSFSAQYLVVNLGAFLSPLLVVFLSDSLGYFLTIMALGVFAIIPVLLMHFFQNELNSVDSSTTESEIPLLTNTKIIGLIALFSLVTYFAFELFWVSFIGDPTASDSPNEILALQGFALGITIMSLVAFLFVKPRSVSAFKTLFFVFSGLILLGVVWLELILIFNIQSYANLFFFIILFSVVEAAVLPISLSLFVKFKVPFLTTAIVIIGLLPKLPSLLLGYLDLDNNSAIKMAIPIGLILIFIVAVWWILKYLKQANPSYSQPEDRA